MEKLTLNKRQRIAGGLLGLLIGDALGVPYEFHSANEIPLAEQINFEPPVGFHRTHQVPPATWSADGAQALCLLASLLYCNKLDLQDFAKRLVNWYELGYMAVDNLVYDVGFSSAQAIRALKVGIEPVLAGAIDEHSSHGNGSLMRVLPLALWHQGSDEDLVKDAQQQSRVTHGHLRSQVCCALYCLIARSIMQNSLNPWQTAVQKLRAIYQTNSKAQEQLEFFIRPDDDISPTGGGYVVDSIRAVKKTLAIDNYQQAVRYAISLGNDTDTTACIVGGIIGLRDGVNSIPQEWRDKLRGKELYEPLLEPLLIR